jgi:anthranilate synthase component 1
LALSRLPEIPDLLRLHVGNPERYPFLLQSNGNSGWDILFAFPSSIEIVDLSALRPGDSDFLRRLDQQWSAARPVEQEACSGDLPFRGGWFAYLGYELLHEIEPSIVMKRHGETFPIGCLARVPAAIQVNRETGEAWLCVESGGEAIARKIRADLSLADPGQTLHAAPEMISLEEENPVVFLDGVARIKEYIRAGDVFQVNLSRLWQGQLAPDITPAQVFQRLRVQNPAPFSGVAVIGSSAIISSSPERLVRVRDGIVQTRPIAGTHPRSSDPEEDERLKAALAQHPKEQAEHIMLVDLERNDLGRLCEPGSVVVDELAAVRTYAHVHHIESNVRGRLRAEITPGEVLRAMFPGGTITGCPKVRTMEIIRELEISPRLAYTGSMGYINHDGSMDFNILIRTFMQQGDRLWFRAGAGIVADSEPERELAETRAKAKGLLRALAGSEP